MIMDINKKHLKFFKRIIIVLLWFVVLFGIYNGYNYNKYWKEHPQTVYDGGHEQIFPEEMYIKVELHNNFVTTVYVALFFVLLYFLIDYFYDPKNHFYTIYIEKWINKLKNMEDDEGDK